MADARMGGQMEQGEQSNRTGRTAREKTVFGENGNGIDKEYGD